MTSNRENALLAKTRASIEESVKSNQFETALEMLANVTGYRAISSVLSVRLSRLKEQARKKLITKEVTDVAYYNLAEDIFKLLSTGSHELNLEEGALPFVPQLPTNYVWRADFKRIETALLEQTERYFGITGLSGSGKTVLATALAHSQKVQVAYDGEVFWVGSSEKPGARFAEDAAISYQKQLGAQLQNEPFAPSKFNTWQEGLVTLQRAAKSKLADKKCLIIVDDPPADDDIFKALEIHEDAVFLITTPDRSLLHAKGVKQGAIFTLQGLDEEEAIGLLSRWTEIPVAELPPTAEEILRKVDYLPLAIAMVGAVMKGAIDPRSAWSDVLEAIKEGDLEDISHPVDKYPLGTLTNVFNLGLSQLAEAHRNRFYELAIFPTGWRFELGTFFVLWKDEKERKVRIFVERLVDKAFLQPIGLEAYVLHSLVRLHIRNVVSDLLPIYRRTGPLLFQHTPLPILATVWQDADALTDMVNRVNIDEEFSSGSTALHVAAERGYQGLCNILLDAGALIDKRSTKGVTALMLASQNGWSNVVTSLVHRGAQLGLKDLDGNAALHYAAKSGHGSIAGSLVRNGATANLSNNHKLSALHLAAFHGHASVVEELLSFLPMHEYETDPQRPLLPWTVNKGHLNIVRILLDTGAPIDSSSPGDGSTALHVAAFKGRPDIVEMLVKAKASINCQMTDGFTPLHLAAQGGHIEIVKTLLATGADVYATTSRRYTPLHSATQERHPEERQRQVVQALIEAAADVNAQNDIFLTPLHNVAINLDTRTARLLIDAGADVNSTEANGYSALHMVLIHRGTLSLTAARQSVSFSMTEEGSRMEATTAFSFEDGLSLITLFLENGINVNLKSKNGNYPLHFAAGNGDSATVELLLEAGADPDVTNGDGDTPLDLAVKGAKTIHNQPHSKRNYAGVIELLQQSRSP
ncbi:MAG TPA: ankyrin repeat domain-containing protein [Pyrinomonadaceae bacterium]|nr:ankyrin repeat domain-containing protein [Pyrinomonadaceae bacterium]